MKNGAEITGKSSRSFRDKKGGYDIQMERAQRDDEGILHSRPGQCHRGGCDGSEREGEYLGCVLVEIQDMPMEYVRLILIQNSSGIPFNTLLVSFCA